MRKDYIQEKSCDRWLCTRSQLRKRSVHRGKGPCTVVGRLCAAAVHGSWQCASKYDKIEPLMEEFLYVDILPASHSCYNCRHKVLDYIYSNNNLGEWWSKTTFPNFSHGFLIDPEPHCCDHCSPILCLSCCDLCNPGQTKNMHALDQVPKVVQKPKRIKVDTEYTPNDDDKKLKVALISWRRKVHKEAWPNGNLYLRPTAMVSNDNLMLLCHLTHAHAIKTPSNIEKNIWSPQVPMIMKDANTIVHLIHSIIPPPSPKLKSTLIPPTPKTLKPINLVHAAVGKAPLQCSACQGWGHTSKSYFAVFVIPNIYNQQSIARSVQRSFRKEYSQVHQ